MPDWVGEPLEVDDDRAFSSQAVDGPRVFQAHTLAGVAVLRHRAGNRSAFCIPTMRRHEG